MFAQIVFDKEKVLILTTVITSITSILGTGGWWKYRVECKNLRIAEARWKLDQAKWKKEQEEWRVEKEKWAIEKTAAARELAEAEASLYLPVRTAIDNDEGLRETKRILINERDGKDTSSGQSGYNMRHLAHLLEGIGRHVETGALSIQTANARFGDEIMLVHQSRLMWRDDPRDDSTWRAFNQLAVRIQQERANPTRR